jgi:hypothetical protein
MDASEVELSVVQKGVEAASPSGGTSPRSLLRNSLSVKTGEEDDNYSTASSRGAGSPTSSRRMSGVSVSAGSPDITKERKGSNFGQSGRRNSGSNKEAGSVNLGRRSGSGELLGPAGNVRRGSQSANMPLALNLDMNAKVIPTRNSIFNLAEIGKLRGLISHDSNTLMLWTWFMVSYSCNCFCSFLAYLTLPLPSVNVYPLFTTTHC